MRRKLRFIILFILALIKLEAQNSAVTADLDTLYQTLIKIHPKLICGENREKFDSSYILLKSNFERYSMSQRIFEMTKLVAGIHDGHTQVGIGFDTASQFHQLPFRFYLYSNGAFIRKISEEYAIYAGMKVLKIGNLPIDSLIKKTLPLIHGENESAIKDILPSRLVIPELLNFVNAISTIDSVPLLLEDSLQKIYQVFIRPVSINTNIKWVPARNTKSAAPLYLQNQDKNYWFTYLGSEQIFYFQFNAVEDMEGISFERFVDSMFIKINALPVKKMIIDLRHNNGGDNTLNKYLLHALIRSDKVNKPGKLFTIIGRLTFSAAVNLAADLESHTNTLFVGEPTAAGPNHYGETRVLRLPITHLTVLYSSQYWQSSFPWDKRTSIAPSIPVQLSSNDYRNNIDPCFSAIKNYKNER